ACFEQAEAPSTPRLGEEERVDLVLRQGVVAAFLADEHETGRFGDELEKTRVDEPVVHDDVGAAQAATPAHGEKSGVAGASAHEGDATNAAHAVASAWSRCRRASSRRPAAIRRRTSPPSARRHASAA